MPIVIEKAAGDAGRTQARARGAPQDGARTGAAGARRGATIFSWSGPHPGPPAPGATARALIVSRTRTRWFKQGTHHAASARRATGRGVTFVTFVTRRVTL